MTDEMFEKILRAIELPLGKLLLDGTTYRITHRNFKRINLPDKIAKDLDFFDKFLVLTSDGKTVVGGVLFYGSIDIQVFIFPEYRGMHYMSKIHKNGIFKAECYPGQRVTLSVSELHSINDYKMKEYLLNCVGLNIGNKDEIYEHYSYLLVLDRRFLRNKKSDIRKFIEENFEKEAWG